MANDYLRQFNELVSKKIEEGYDFFSFEEYFMEEKKWTIMSFNLDIDLVTHAYRIAEEKVKHTMDENQAGVIRSYPQKIERQTQGVLAETAVQLFFLFELNTVLKRYDLERSSFEYSTEEYDLKYEDDFSDITIEVRSSNAYSKTELTLIRYGEIIGPYVNDWKKSEDWNDFYIRPFYFPKFKLFDSFGKINDDLTNGNIQLKILGIADRQIMEYHSFIGDLGQQGTKYKLCKIIDCYDIRRFVEKYRNNERGEL